MGGFIGFFRSSDYFNTCSTYKTLLQSTLQLHSDRCKCALQKGIRLYINVLQFTRAKKSTYTMAVLVRTLPYAL